MDVMARRRAIMAHIARLVKKIISSVTGLVSFTTNVIRPVKVTCEFSPVQEGTGDPSPDNVRPISGWTGCEIGHTGKNLFDSSNPEKVSGKIKNDSGDIIKDSTGSFSQQFVRVKPSTSYFISGLIETRSKRAYFYTKDKTWISRTSAYSGVSEFSITTPANCLFIQLQSGYNDTYETVQIEEGNSVTAYEPYQGATLPITFTDPSTGDPLTVYGGTVTLNEDGSADLVATQALWVEDGTRQPTYTIWKTSGEGDLYNCTLFGRLPRPQHDYAGGYSKYFISDNRMFINDINGHGWENKLCFASYRSSALSFAYSIPKNLSTKAEVAAYFAENPTTVVYSLATPITYHFDNIGQLNSFLGENNIWHDMNGSITAEYYKKQ